MLEEAKASLKPRPGREGTMSVNGWVDVGELGEVRGAKRGVRERFVRGNVGRSRRGRACVCGDLMWRKWIRRGGEGGYVGSESAVRYCGSVVLRWVSRWRQV